MRQLKASQTSVMEIMKAPLQSVAAGLVVPRLPNTKCGDADTLAFASLCAAYGAEGGLAPADRLVFDGGGRLAIGTVARWIVERQLIVVHWNGDYWLPRFQFAPTLVPHTEIAAPLAELRAVLDDWDIAGWFSERNCWLGGQRPCAVILQAPREVHDAARALRFLIRA